MDTSPTKARTGRAAVALATIAPLIVVVLATPGTMMIGEQYGTDALPFVLVAWCVVLLGFAIGLNRVLLHEVKSLLPFLAAVVVILAIWFWQRQAFALLVPHGPYVRLFPPAGRCQGSILGSFVSILGGFGLPVGLLPRCPDSRVACRRPPFVGLHDSVVASGVYCFCISVDVPRRPRKRFHLHLTTVCR